MRIRLPKEYPPSKFWKTQFSSHLPQPTQSQFFGLFFFFPLGHEVFPPQTFTPRAPPRPILLLLLLPLPLPLLIQSQ
jgi:hypothetical protein